MAQTGLAVQNRVTPQGGVKLAHGRALAKSSPLPSLWLARRFSDIHPSRQNERRAEGKSNYKCGQQVNGAPEAHAASQDLILFMP